MMWRLQLLMKRVTHILDAFYIDNGLIEFFDLGKNPINRYSFSIGEDTVKGKGFFITSTCIGCGKCLRGCPQNHT